MQIGDQDVDRVYEEAIAPAVRDAGLEPSRIDQDNQGGLLKAEIMAAIEASDIIVADLTNERQNCYLEVGYAIGLGRNPSLVLAVRQDHLPGHSEHVPGGPKVHFDLAGYDLCLWDPTDLAGFRNELRERILRRLALTAPAAGDPTVGPVSSDSWTVELRTEGLAKIEADVGPGYMQIVFELGPPKAQRTQRELLDAAWSAAVGTFGWPIGLVIDRAESRPKPTGSGIRAEVTFERGAEKSFDLWELRTNGDFFTIKSLFEDQRGHPDQLLFNTRIVRVTEAFLYCGRLYSQLGVPREARIRVTIEHGGLEDRVLASSTPSRHLSMPNSSTADSSTTSIEFALGEIDERLPDLVRQVTSPLFELFDFFVLSREVHDEIVERFLRGEVS